MNENDKEEKSHDMSKYVDYITWVRLTLFRLYTMGSRGLHFTVANSFVNFT